MSSKFSKIYNYILFQKPKLCHIILYIIYILKEENDFLSIWKQIKIGQFFQMQLMSKQFNIVSKKKTRSSQLVQLNTEFRKKHGPQKSSFL